MNETTSLIEKAKRYLKSAETLIRDGGYESSVSRSYYAMFYAAEAALLKKGLFFSSHKGVISGFGKYFVKTGIFSKQMGRELNRAFEKDRSATMVISLASLSRQQNNCWKPQKSLSVRSQIGYKLNPKHLI